MLSVPTKKKSATAVVTKPKGKITAASKSKKSSDLKPKTAAAKKVTAKAKAVPRATATPKRRADTTKPKATKIVTEMKERKTTIAAAPKKKKKIVSSHPTYEGMIKDAIVTLKERTGSSQYAIQKFIEEKHKELPPTFRKLLLHNLKRLVASGKLVKVKASFKLPSASASAKSSSPKAVAGAATSVPTKKISANIGCSRSRELVLKEQGLDVKERSFEEIEFDRLLPLTNPKLLSYDPKLLSYVDSPGDYWIDGVPDLGANRYGGGIYINDLIEHERCKRRWGEEMQYLGEEGYEVSSPFTLSDSTSEIGSSSSF